MAVVAEGSNGRIYLAPTPEHEAIARQAVPAWKPEVEMNQNSKDLLSGRGYGFKWWHELFTPRQLVALTTFSDLVAEAMQRIQADALTAGMAGDDVGLDAGGSGATAYAQAVGVYLAMAVDKITDYNSSLVAWSSTRDQLKTTFARQALPMVWDYAETNMFASAAGDVAVSIEGIIKALPSIAGVNPNGTYFGRIGRP